MTRLSMFLVCVLSAALAFGQAVTGGSTSQTFNVKLYDSTTGAPKTGLDVTTFTLGFVRTRAAIVSVLPAPAPAMTTSGPGGAQMTAACSSVGVGRPRASANSVGL